MWVTLLPFYLAGDTIQAHRICTQEERLTHLRQQCEKWNISSIDRLMTPADRVIVDNKYNLTLCYISKAGCTALKLAILEANGYKIKNNKVSFSYENIHGKGMLHRYGLDELAYLDIDKRWQIVESHLNMFSIRHPFDRLVSYYFDKIALNDGASSHPWRQAQVLQSMRPELFRKNRTLSQMKYPQTDLGYPRFDEFVTWLYKKKAHDQHWRPIMDTCHPCAHPWGAIMRIETMNTDGQILMNKLNSNVSTVAVRHSHDEKKVYSFEKTLSNYHNVSDDVIDYLLGYFQRDMEMFGYHWDKRTHLASCAIQTENGICC